MCGIVLPSLVILGMLPVAIQIGYADGAFTIKGFILGLGFHLRRWENISRLEKGVESRFLELISRPTGKIFLKNAYTTLKRLMPRMWIPCLSLKVLAAGRNPDIVSLAYGVAGTLMQGLQAWLSDRVSDADLRVDVDYLRDKTEIRASIRAGLYLYQVLWSAIGFGRGCWRDYRKQKRSMSIHEQSATG